MRYHFQTASPVTCVIYNVTFLFPGLICGFLVAHIMKAEMRSRFHTASLVTCIISPCDVSVSRFDLLLPQRPPQRGHSGLPVVLPQSAGRQGQAARYRGPPGSLALPFPPRHGRGGRYSGAAMGLCGISEREHRFEAGVRSTAFFFVFFCLKAFPATLWNLDQL